MNRFVLLLCTGLIFFSASVLSQNKQIRITGKIYDQETGAILPGASVSVKGTYTGTVSGLDGDYSILVSDSDATLVFGFIGCATQEIVVGDKRVIDVAMITNSTDLEEVVITMQARGQIGARNSQINSNTLVNVVAPDRLQENPDANAIEALGRLPGMSVVRSGGEGALLVIRGLQPQYTNITLDGINLTGGQASLRGISQYALQGAEVYKSLTADMEANSVAGTVNLTTQETPEGLHYDLMAQGGYNALNSYFGNYKFLGEVSNRFFDNKLGASLTLSTERVNRGTQTMSAGYGIIGEEIDILINASSLNIINRINTRSSANLSLDFQLHPSTKLKFNAMYSNANMDTQQQSKTYNHTGAGSVGYSMIHNPINENNTLYTSLRGKTNAKFLNMEIDYGLAYSQNQRYDPNSRRWDFTVANASTADITTVEMRRLTAAELIPLFTDDEIGLENTYKGSFYTSDIESSDKDITAYLDLKAPFHIGEHITGNVKFGGKYRRKELYVDVLSGWQQMHPFSSEHWYEGLPWLQPYILGGGDVHTLEGFEEHEVDEFLGRDYDYGTWFSFDMLNETSDWWEAFSDSLFSLGRDVWVPMLGGKTHLLGYVQNVQSNMYNDRDALEDYYAGYAMGELNFGKWIMFMPGFRYEKTEADLNGRIVIQPNTDAIPFYLDPLPGTDTATNRVESFFLPMVHLRIKPTDFFYIHLAYTNTLSRPDFNLISPNIYVNPQVNPFVYKSRNPELRSEYWTNYDAQFTFHSNKVGLLSLSGFYKTVEDKIWNRTYKRLKDDPPVEPYFTENDVVDMSVWENHKYEVLLGGIEFEWQTSFWYLPKPFNYFTLSANYTYTYSETKYPLSWQESVVPPEGGRPTKVRIDSVVTGPMLLQPKHIANISLGFNYKGLNAWLSYQYNGEIFTSKNYYVEELDRMKEYFYRIDLQVSYELPIDIPGKLQVLGNFANLNNFNEVSRLRGDPRFTYQEAYGFTVDLGVRYNF